MLRAYVISSKDAWEKWLPIAEFSYNIAIKRVLKWLLLKVCMAANIELL